MAARRSGIGLLLVSGISTVMDLGSPEGFPEALTGAALYINRTRRRHLGQS